MVWSAGICGYGGGMFLFSVAASSFSSGLTGLVFSLEKIGFNLIVCALGGCIWGVLMWAFMEEAHRKAVKEKDAAE